MGVFTIADVWRIYGGVRKAMSNTAERWWVRLAARWLARIDGVSGQLRLAMLGMTGVSTGLVALKSYGLGRFAWPLIIGTGMVVVIYTYLFTEGGVWNQMARDRVDLSTNYAGPTLRIDDEMIARGLVAGTKGETLNERERSAISNELDEAFYQYRDGLPEEYFDEP